jgi:hypothetical protein
MLVLANLATIDYEHATVNLAHSKFADKHVMIFLREMAREKSERRDNATILANQQRAHPIKIALDSDAQRLNQPDLAYQD